MSTAMRITATGVKIRGVLGCSVSFHIHDKINQIINDRQAEVNKIIVKKNAEISRLRNLLVKSESDNRLTKINIVNKMLSRL